MEELIQFSGQHYILAASSLAEDRNRVLKQGETFAVFDRYGDIRSVGLGEQGLYHEGTRFVSRLRLRFGGVKPLLLSSTMKQDNALFTVDLTNPDLPLKNERLFPRGTLHISRSIFLWNGACYERLRLRNFDRAAVSTTFSFDVEADFADVFEVRGTKRERRGARLDSQREDGCLTIRYEGLDGCLRQLRFECSLSPASSSHGSSLQFEVELNPRQERLFYFRALCLARQADAPLQADIPWNAAHYDAAFTQAMARRTRLSRSYSRISPSNERFNNWLQRSLSDLEMMTIELETGPYPDAGVPWYSTRFGRDGIITALETLWVNPEIAAGVLRYLARMQARDMSDEQDAEPGKILHEVRKGEMAALGEIPFGCYYGSVDSTPLFVMLAAAYYERTGNLALIRKLWPSVARALRWIDAYGDIDNDGFVEYSRRSKHGLVQQGWKDSWDSIFHADGSIAHGPIALCEVQGYAYAAKMGGAQLARALGKIELGEELESQAHVLREEFNAKFWCEELSTYALALDGSKRPCRVRTSNAGHALFTGIATREYAARVARTLLQPDFFSGWGIRTVAASERVYNPMSYHNGSVWPHDNALIAMGLARYGFTELANEIFGGLFEATSFVEFHRLPELICGFTKRHEEGPTLYPVACSPQSWAAAAVTALLQASLQLTIKAPQGQIWFEHPRLPYFLNEMEIRNLRVGQASLDLFLRRYGEKDVTFYVSSKKGAVDLITVK